MKTTDLNGIWAMRRSDQSEAISATVPGSVYADLLAAKKMEDPFWRDNELKALPLMEYDYVYERTFELCEGTARANNLILRCDGLDTIAEVSLNGKPIGNADNMYRTWDFDIKGIAKEGENTISILFRSPTKYIKQKNKEYFLDGVAEAMRGFPHIRKAHCMFGWDWGPRLPDAGIWKDIKIIAYENARLENVLIRQVHSHDTVSLTFFPEDVPQGYEVSYTVTCPDGNTYQTYDNSIEIKNPKLWWPNGYGRQYLYSVVANLSKDGKKIDEWSRRIGLRTMTISRDEDLWGQEFCHMVNGVKIFAMGADYIPQDNILSRVTHERIRTLLQDMADINMNVVRIWGGGYYPCDYFYDVCDELGLIVWQDFMYACAMYGLSLPFENNIRAEAVQQVKRLRHRASLGLFCGNNELEWLSKQGSYSYTGKGFSDYIRIFEHILPEVVRENAPDTFYWPSSPSSGGGFDYPNDPSRGNTHYWDVWHGFKPFTDYRNHHFRYVSEFGFQSFPSLKTIESFTLPEDRNIFSYVMEKHQRNSNANGKIMGYLGQVFLYPSTFDKLIYASQLLQAEAIKYGVEHWRRNRGRCMGAIYWQLNDCWPVASWASIDYFGRWKALHYFAKRFFAPIMISVHEEGADPNPNTEESYAPISARLSVANETMADFRGTVKWTLRNARGEVLKKGEENVYVPVLTSLWLNNMDFEDANVFEDYFSFELTNSNGEVISRGSALFTMPKHFKFSNPELSASVDGNIITVSSKAYAKSVEIECADEDLVLEDNYFDMNPGVRKIKVVRGKPSCIRLRSVYDIS